MYTVGCRPARSARRDPRVLRRQRLAAVAVALAVVLAVAVPLFALRGNGPAGAVPAATAPLGGALANQPIERELPRPTAAHPLRIYFGGDSMTGYPIQELTTLARATGVMKVMGDYQVSSRLCYNVPINWPVHLHAKLRALHPRAMVFMIGANDGGAPITAGGRICDFWSRQWFAAFRKIVGRMMDDALASGVQRIYWVGMPIMKPGHYPSSDQMKRLNNAYRKEASLRPGQVRYIDIWRLLATPSGQYDPQWRASWDPTHLNSAGARRIAAVVMAAIKHDWLPKRH
jgi:hypothetical protein